MKQQRNEKVEKTKLAIRNETISNTIKILEENKYCK